MSWMCAWNFGLVDLSMAGLITVMASLTQYVTVAAVGIVAAESTSARISPVIRNTPT